MGLVTTAGNYCYVQCDTRNCNRKMEHMDPKPLKDLAKLCGWENSGTHWTCPDCTEVAAPRKRSGVRGRSPRPSAEN
jgi:hypothetical protein